MTEPMGERGRQGAAPLGGHTPGPWRVVGGDEEDLDRLTGWGPAIAAGEEPPEPDGPNRYIAEVISDGDSETDANARLIAAAPELLEAAELAFAEAESWIHDQLDGTSHLDDALKRLAPVRAAIAKARGEQ